MGFGWKQGTCKEYNTTVPDEIQVVENRNRVIFGLAEQAVNRKQRISTGFNKIGFKPTKHSGRQTK